ncbi:MAG TPA: metallophosphoesterase family protein [Chitinophagales bacterium]|jgi:putative phosphoesterase|nr:metallophosphoesterase family protein [Chitinophagales bacterium]HPH87318.1 metallophosphoesterase family protein [Chitinophagales bacterium]
MTRIGIISDTHNYLDEKVFDYFKDVDMIWHAGDIGTQEVTDKLKAFKPLYAVHGNIDGHELRAEFPENQLIDVEGCKIFITHIAGAVGKYNSRVVKIIQEQKPAILVCGHSHIVKVIKDINYNLLHINSGAAGIHGFHKMRTIIRFEIENGKPQKMELIELGLRGKITQ